MATSKSDPLAIPKLQAVDTWGLWKEKLNAVISIKVGARLRFPDDPQQEGDAAAAAGDDMSPSDKIKVTGYIKLSISDTLLLRVTGLTDPNAIIQRIYEHFYVKTGSTATTILGQLNTISMYTNETPDVFGSRIDGLCAHAHTQGLTITSENKITWFRAGLPKTTDWFSFKTTLAAADALPPNAPGKNVTSDYDILVNAATVYHATIQHELAATEQQALIVKTKAICQHCKSPRHPSDKCWKKHPHLRPRKPKKPCRHCNGDHWNDECPQRQNKKVYLTSAASTMYLLDSASSVHVTNDPSLLATSQPADTSVGGIGGRAAVTAIGTIHGFPGTTYLIPSAKDNLVSIGQLDQHGWHTSFIDGAAHITNKRTGRLIAKVPRQNNMYPLHTETCFVVTPEDQAAHDMFQFHRANGHLGIDKLRQAAALQGIDTSKWPKDLPPCDACNKAQVRKAPVGHKPMPIDPALKPGQRLHADLVGPVNKTEHILDIVDAASRYEMVEYMLHKSETPKATAKLIDANYTHLFGPEELGSDRGSEFTSKDMIEMLRERAIRPFYSAPNTPQHNGLAERTHAISINMARAMLQDSGLDPDKFFKKAHRLAVYINNTTPKKVLGGKTPYEIFHRRAPVQFANLPFGARVAYHTKSGAKFNKRTAEGLYMGPALGVVGGAIEVYCPETNKFIITRSYKALTSATDSMPKPQLDADAMPIPELSMPGFSDDEDEGIAIDSAAVRPLQQQQDHSGPATPMDSPRTIMREMQQMDQGHTIKPLHTINAAGFDELPTNRSQRAARHDKKEETSNHVYHVSADDINEPRTYRQAMEGPARAEWEASIRREVIPLYQQRVYSIVPADTVNKVPINSRYVFKIKKDATFKTRLVACGYAQEEGLDFFIENISAQVVGKDATRATIAAAVAKGYHFRQFDFDQAYINADLDTTIYMRPPPGLADALKDIITAEEHDLLASGKALLCLHKALYGLRQSGFLWGKQLSDTLRSFGLRQSALDPCVYYADGIIVIIYVDDGLIMTKDGDAAAAFIKKLHSVYKCKDLGLPSDFLGVNFKFNTDGSIFLHQRPYTEKLGAKFADGMHARATPIAQGAALDNDAPRGDRRDFLEILGSALYATTTTRLDAAYAVSAISSHAQNPSVAHIRLARNIVAYLANTSNLGLLYKPADGEINIEVYTDASFAPKEHLDRRSQTGFIVLVNGTPVAYGSNKQKIIAVSTAESEIIALFAGVRMALFIQRLLTEIGFNISGPIIAHEDNSAAKAMVERVATKQSKHIAVRYHRLRELASTGEVKIVYCHTSDQIADALTKALPKDVFIQHRDRFMAKGEC